MVWEDLSLSAPAVLALTSLSLIKRCVSVKNSPRVLNTSESEAKLTHPDAAASDADNGMRCF